LRGEIQPVHGLVAALLLVGKVAQILFHLAVVFLRDAILGRLADGIAVAGRQIEILAGAGLIGSRAGIGDTAAVRIGPVAVAAAHVLFVGDAALLLIGIGRLAGLTGLLARLTWLARLTGLLTGLPRLPWLARLSGLAGLSLLRAGLSGVQ